MRGTSGFLGHLDAKHTCPVFDSARGYSVEIRHDGTGSAVRVVLINKLVLVRCPEDRAAHLPFSR